MPAAPAAAAGARPALSPLPISTGTTLSIGGNDGCNVRADGSLHCWNYARGPQPVGTATDFLSVHLRGTVKCAIRAPGTLHCWGNHRWGSPVSLQPLQIGSDDDWSQVSADQSHGCAIKQGGALHCWGEGAAFGVADSAAPPTAVGTGHRWVAVSAGLASTCALDQLGRIGCWAEGGPFEAPPGTVQPLAAGEPGWMAVSLLHAGRGCAIRRDGALFCWGGATGVTGDSVPDAKTLRPMGTRRDWTAVDVAHQHACARAADATLHCWGATAGGRLGRLRQRGLDSIDTPLRIGRAHDIARFATGPKSTCASGADGKVRCAGDVRPPLVDATMRWSPESFEPFTAEERTRSGLDEGMPTTDARATLRDAVGRALSRHRRKPSILARELMRDRGGALFAHVDASQRAYPACRALQRALRETQRLDVQLAASGADLWPDQAALTAHFPETTALPGVVVNRSPGLAARLPAALARLGAAQEIAGAPDGTRLFTMPGPLAVVLLGEDHAIAGPPAMLARWLSRRPAERQRAGHKPGCGLRRRTAHHRFAPLRLELQAGPAGDDLLYHRLEITAVLPSEDAARVFAERARAGQTLRFWGSLLGLRNVELLRQRGATLSLDQLQHNSAGVGGYSLLFALALTGGEDFKGVLESFIKRR